MDNNNHHKKRYIAKISLQYQRRLHNGNRALERMAKGWEKLLLFIAFYVHRKKASKVLLSLHMNVNACSSCPT